MKLKCEICGIEYDLDNNDDGKIISGLCLECAENMKLNSRLPDIAIGKFADGKNN